MSKVRVLVRGMKLSKGKYPRQNTISSFSLSNRLLAKMQGTRDKIQGVR